MTLHEGEGGRILRALVEPFVGKIEAIENKYEHASFRMGRSKLSRKNERESRSSGPSSQCTTKEALDGYELAISKKIPS